MSARKLEKRLSTGSIADLTVELRREARRQGFGRRELAAAIKEVRKEIYESGKYTRNNSKRASK